jgi:hypothetical protein
LFGVFFLYIFYRCAAVATIATQLPPPGKVCPGVGKVASWFVLTNKQWCGWTNEPDSCTRDGWCNVAAAYATFVYVNSLSIPTTTAPI